MIPSQELLNSNKMYQKLHASRKDYFRGRTLTRYLPDLFYIVEGSNIQSVLDYGCGKAELWKHHGLRSLLGVKLFLYDPGVVEFQKKPIVPVDNQVRLPSLYQNAIVHMGYHLVLFG